MNKICWQINLQRRFGGGEVYTAFMARALRARGWETHTIVARDADFWKRLDLGDTTLHPVRDPAQISELLTAHKDVVFHHGAPSPDLRIDRPLLAIAHMPVHDRDPEPFRPCYRVLGVSRYVIRTLRERGLSNVHGEPLYGVADLTRMAPEERRITARSRFDWDERKLRDRSFKRLEPGYRLFIPTRVFSPRPGLSLSIVSRLTTIKQFPALMTILAPIIARHSGVNLEIFGAGGWRSVKDLEAVLEPIQERVRWWGFQHDVRRVYGLVDFVLGGLPEQEALGLNLLEAQAAGAPVLVPDAPPFDETVEHGFGGFRYVDPREDGGADFERLLGRLITGLRPEPPRTGHLRRFDLDAFGERLERALPGAPVNNANDGR